MNAIWMLRVLRWAYVAFIANASVMAISAGVRGAGQGKHNTPILLALAIPELLAALAFLVEPVEVAAGALLLLVYTAATILSLLSGDFLAPLRFVYFAVTALYIVQAHRKLPARTNSAAAA